GYQDGSMFIKECQMLFKNVIDLVGSDVCSDDRTDVEGKRKQPQPDWSRTKGLEANSVESGRESVEQLLPSREVSQNVDYLTLVRSCKRRNDSGLCQTYKSYLSYGNEEPIALDAYSIYDFPDLPT